MAEHSNINKVVLISAGALVVIVAAILLVWHFAGGGAEVVEGPGPEVGVVEPLATIAPPAEPELSERLVGVTLRTSDPVVRELIAELSTHPKLVAWLVSEDLVRRFTATVANVASGRSPRAHLEFLAPGTPFKIVERGEELFVDPASYRRYDAVAEVIDSIDATGAAELYRELRPLIEEAYREIAPPDRVFDDTLRRAFAQLTTVPVDDSEVRLEEKVVTYTFADERLEGLSDAQRHLLRMGPDNVRLVQAKLREIEEALSAPAEAAPETEIPES